MSHPLFSVITPVYRPPLTFFFECVGSVLDQSFPDFELVLVDDGNDDPALLAALADLEATHRAVRVIHSANNVGIAGASQLGLEAAQGAFVAFLDHDDLLTPDALERVATRLAVAPDIDYVYTDEDKVDDSGRYYEGFFKPDWSPERFRSHMYVCHLSVVRRSLALEVGGFRLGFDGSQDYDFILRVTEKARRIEHVQEILYHWRAHSGSTALNPHQKPAAYAAAKRALTEHCQRVGINADVQDGLTVGAYRVTRRLSSRPDVSLIIPTNGKIATIRGHETMLVEHLIKSVEEKTTYDCLEYVVVHDSRMPEVALTRIRQAASYPVATVSYDHADTSFNFSEAINRGAARARGDILLLLNDDMELITADWIEQFAGFLQEPDVGAVGGKYYYEDDSIQHAGVALVEPPSHLFHQAPRGTTRMLGTHLTVTREVSALTAACLAVTRDNFLAVGGFTEQLPTNYNDVDFCLKLRARGLRNIWTPHVELYHYESQTREPGIDPAESELLARRWGARLHTDPYYNPNLQTLAPSWEAYPDWQLVARGWRREVYDAFALDIAGYLDVNTDLAAAMAANPDWDLVEHFERYGVREKRMQTVGLRHRPQGPAQSNA